MKLVYSILLSKEINKDEFVSFVKDTELLFVPRLSTRVSLIEYAEKMYQYATLFIVRDMDDAGKLIACNAVYVNVAPLDSFATFLVVKEKYANYGIGAKLIIKAVRYSKELGSSGYSLKMRASNKVMYDFYLRLGFIKVSEGKYPNSEEYEYDLRNDLDLTSFDLAELTVRIEDEFDIDIFEDGLVNTIGEVLAKLEK